MKLLLDTHSFIWFFSGNPKLSNTARIYMEDVKHQKLISLATVWEMAIKQSKNKLTLALPLEDYIQQKQDLRNEDLSLRPKRSVGKQSQDFCDYVAVARNDAVTLLLRKS